MTEDTRPLEKLFAGARLRRLRRERGLTQADAAQALGVSASYLNLLERNQRPVTARVLLALAENFDVDVRAFANESDQQLIADLQEAAADPVLNGFELDRLELNELADSHPRAAEAFARLYQTYRETSAATADLATRMSGPGSTLESVRDAIDASQNHYPELEAAAVGLLERSGTRRRDRDRTLAKYLLDEHGFTVRVLDEEMMAGARRRLDFHGRRLLLSEVLPSTSRAFHMAVALANLECGELIDDLITRANLPNDDSRRLYRLGLANYLAGAIQMPYEAFLAAAEESRYDLYVLQRRFEASYEQVCHRLTTLQRSGARGLPFFMIRVDGAGNVSKRFGGGIMPFVRSGGGCPKWNLYDALRLPERIHAQSFELPDGRRFLSLARGQVSPAPAGQTPVLHAIALGCDWDHASRIMHADGLADSAPQALGIACRLCERSECAQRAFPPINRKLDVEPHVLGGSPYGFDPTS